jgi:hypothetical protein
MVAVTVFTLALIFLCVDAGVYDRSDEILSTDFDKESSAVNPLVYNTSPTSRNAKQRREITKYNLYTSPPTPQFPHPSASNP